MKTQRLHIVFSVMFALFGYMSHCYAYDPVERLYDMDLPGNNFRFFPLVIDRDFNNSWTSNSASFRRYILIPAANECQNDCDHDSRCLAWTYKFYGYRQMHALYTKDWFRVRVRGECFLKNGVPPVVPRSMHISGVKPVPSGSGARQGTTNSAAMPPKEYNTNRLGGDYRQISMKNNNPNKCQMICMKDVRCKAWTYVKPRVQGKKAQCWLKDSVPKKTHNSCCISGRK